MYLKCYISSRVIKLDSVVKYLDFFSGKYTDFKLCKYTNIRSLKARKNIIKQPHKLLTMIIKLLTLLPVVRNKSHCPVVIVCIWFALLKEYHFVGHEACLCVSISDLDC